MKMSAEGYQQCYNVQAAVVGGHQLVAATEVTSNASDQGALAKLLDAEEEHMARARRRHWRAGALQRIGLGGAGVAGRGRVRGAGTGRDGKAAARNAERHPATCRIIEKLGTPEGRARYAERKWLSEAPNGWIKEVLGFRCFSVRGLKQVAGQWDLVCLALNVKRLGAIAAA